MTNKETALYVWTKRDADYFHVFVGFGYVGEKGELTWGDSYDRRKDGLHFSDGLRVVSQGTNAEYDGSTDKRHLYGFELEYREPFSVDARKASAMAKTLRTLERKLRALAEKQGRPTTFGQYVGQVAQAVGAKRFYVQHDKVKYPQTLTDEFGRYAVGTVAELVAEVNNLEYQWQREGKPEAVNAF